MPFILPSPMSHRGKSYPHTGELEYLGTQCAAFVQKVFNGVVVPGRPIGLTASWKQGTRVWPPSSENQTLSLKNSMLPASLQKRLESPQLQCMLTESSPTPRIAMGTVVATFENGKYPSNNQHVAVFIDYIPNGFRVIDQYAKKRIVDFANIDNHDGKSYDPRRYFTVEIN